MKFIMTLFLGIATLVWGVFACVPLTGRDIQWANTTTTTTTTMTIMTINTTTAFVGCGTGITSGSLTSASKTTSADPSVYTIPSNFTVPGNGTIEPIRWHLYSLQAFSDLNTQTAHYAFQAVIQPNVYTVACYVAERSSHGKLDGVDNAQCHTPAGPPPKDGSVPVTFHFAWKSKLHDNLGRRGNLLVVKSNSPGSSHACPSHPYDACWAQGLYWIPELQIKPTDTGDRYNGPESVFFGGTYCRTGMPECVWSEYLY